MTRSSDHDNYDADYDVDYRPAKQAQPQQQRRRRPSHARGNKSPVAFNGIHRRRRKKIG